MRLSGCHPRAPCKCDDSAAKHLEFSYLWFEAVCQGGCEAEAALQQGLHASQVCWVHIIAEGLTQHASWHTSLHHAVQLVAPMLLN